MNHQSADAEVARPRRRVSNVDESRAVIISAAAECFMRKGLDKATIDDIADEVGSTKGRVYHHFRSKNAIFFAVYRRAMELCFEAVEPVFASDSPAAQRLEGMADAHAMVMMEHLPFQRGIRSGVEMYLHGSTTAAERETLTELIGIRDEYERLFRRVLEDGVADATLEVDDVPIAGRAILGALNGLTDWYRPRTGESGAEREAIARSLTRTVLNGVVRR
ncbi:TetR/AcrR family transcriptional regulator [Oceaniradius stylonematis]|uniref:TetR/AcrR family transcriptional regulator n=1 Tax=Oceaniradius stylonematis TaxID=2184161 RepID=UPI00273FDE54|nr:TetR/AcrR family transcriptional regulator [Oceaniradius stylonematis]